MSWKSAASYSKRLFEKRVEGWQGENANTASHPLPLGARIGSVVQLQKAPFIRAITHG